MEVLVLRHQHALELGRTLPDDVVSRTTETQQADMDCARREVAEMVEKRLGQLLAEEHPHDQAAGIPKVLRSRSAA